VQSALQKPDGGAVFFSGEALYAGRDMGTFEAALGQRRRSWSPNDRRIW
jgi:hypothetical protein